MVIKGSKTIEGKETKAEDEAWGKFRKQQALPFMSLEERCEDAFRTGYRVGREVEKKKHDAFVKRLTDGKR